MKKVIAKVYSFTLRSKITDNFNGSQISLDTGTKSRLTLVLYRVEVVLGGS